MGARLGQASPRGHHEDFSGRTIHIHGKPYRFHHRLGSGGFGTVYSARSPHGTHVAIKVVDLNMIPGARQALVDSYLNEVRHLEKLRKISRHVVTIYDFDFDPRRGRAYIVMELGGDNLTTSIDRLRSIRRGHQGPGTYVDPIIRKEIWRQLVIIVKTLTENDVVHMDLKPDNIIVFGRTLKIADLGVSKKSHKPGQPGLGTPGFSAPEVMTDYSGYQKFYGPKADVWSLGAILYYMTYGRVPHYRPHAAEPPHGHSPSHDRALVDMLRRTLVLDPHARANIYSVLRHPYTNR